MLKCVLLSLVLMLGVITALPMDSLDIGITESEADITTKPADITTEEPAHSQLEDEEETEESPDSEVDQGTTNLNDKPGGQMFPSDIDSKDILVNGEEELRSISADELNKLEEHIFVLEDDNVKNMILKDTMENVEETVVGRILEHPDSRKCEKRPNHFSHRGHQYWYSGDEAEYANTKVDWLEARNICRRHCMDLVSIETPAENKMIASFLTDRDLPYTWTSGRLCNFKGCDRKDLQPVNVAGWFWSGSGVRIAPTNSTPPFWGSQPWSHTGHKSQFVGQDVPQPDNAEEEINGSTEACLAVFNDVYDDGVAWHDVACYHRKMFICEDEEDLLKIAKNANP